jgi:hypothetical protein
MRFTGTVKIILLIFFSLVLALCLGACAPSRLAKEDIEHLRISAQKGNVKSRLLLGERYEFGVDGPANPLIASQWYHLAAKLNHPEAQFYLGVMYEQGDVLSRQSSESLNWLFKSAERGHEKAQIYLAAVYLKDKNLRQEFNKRIRRYSQSAKKGNAIAQYNLGWVYREGVGVPVNPRESLDWYRKAARQGNGKAQFALGNIYLEGKVAPANPGEALAWYLKSAKREIRAQVKLYDLYKGAGGIPENAQEAQTWSQKIAQNTDSSLRSYIDMQHAILHSEKRRNPAMALRSCQRISEFDPAYRDVSNTCEALSKRISGKMNPRVQEAESALAKKDWERFRELLSPLMTSDFDESQLRRLIASAWWLIEEETRAKEKIAQEQLRPIQAAERSAAYRRKNRQQIPGLIIAFRATVDQGLRDNPSDASLLALARKGSHVIASLEEKMKPSPPVKEKKVEDTLADFPEDTPEGIEPGDDDYRQALALFDNGQFEEAAILLEKATKIRGFQYIASAYIYLGVSHLARVNPANINEARHLHLKGLACFQNALRFDDDISLPEGYDQYQQVFDEAKQRLH